MARSTTAELIGPRTRQAVEHAPPTNRSAVLQACITHADEVVTHVWPGRTFDPTELKWEWNNRLQSAAGRFNPKCNPAGIELAWDYYTQHDWLELFAVVRHELIHAWQYFHPDCPRTGHGPTFKQWLDDLNTHRHCNHW